MYYYAVPEELKEWLLCSDEHKSIFLDAQFLAKTAECLEEDTVWDLDAIDKFEKIGKIVSKENEVTLYLHDDLYVREHIVDNKAYYDFRVRADEDESNLELIENAMTGMFDYHKSKAALDILTEIIADMTNYDFINGMQNVSSKLRNEKELLASLVCSFRHGAGN